MTTPVGSIRLDLSIDGSSLDDEITAAVRKHMEPVMARLHQQLERIERDYSEAARAAETSGAKQTAAAKTVADAVEDVGDEHTKTAAKARVAEGVSTRSINATTRAIERQTAAWTANAAARTAAAAAPTPGPPQSGGGGAGRGGGGGNHLSRGRSGSGGFFGFGGPIVGAAGWNAVAAVVGSFPAAATAVTNLTGAVQQLAQAGLVLPGVIGGVVSSVLTAKLGFVGMSDAVEAAWKAFQSGDPKDAKKALESLTNLAPAVKDTVKAVSGLFPELQRLQRDVVAQNMFEGIDQTITDLAGKSIPTLEKGLGGISRAWNATFKELGRVAGLDSSQAILDKIFGNTAEAQNRANAVINPLLHGLGTAAAEGTDFLPHLADGLTAVTTRFDNWITRSADNGNLDKWINEGIEAAGHLGETLLNIGKIIASITKAAGGDGGLLAALDNGSGALATFLASDQGQEKLIDFFTEGREQLAKWIEILGNVGSILGDAYNGARQWADMLLPVLKTVTDIISSMPGGISAVVTAFLAWKTISGFTGLLGGLDKVGASLDLLPGRAGVAVGGINKALAGLAIGGVALGVGSELTNSESTASRLGGAALNIGGGAIAGGSIGGPWGAAIGAMIGAGITLFENARRQLEEGKSEWEQSWQRQHDRPEMAPGTPELANRITGNDVIMQPSLKTPNLAPQLADQIRSGKIPGYSIGPDGSIISPSGPIPGINLANPGPAFPDSSLHPGGAAAAPPPTPNPAPPTQQNPLPVFLTNTLPPGVAQNVLPPPVPVTGGGPMGFGRLAGVGPIPQVDAAAANLQKLATDIKELPEGEVKIKDPSPELMKNLQSLDVQITKVSENEIEVKANTDLARGQIDALIQQYKKQTITLLIAAQQAGGGPAVALPAGRADGGVLPGWSPGVDNMLVPMGGGEGVLIPEAVRGLGGASAIYAINSRFRKGLSRQGYADGGVVGELGGVPGLDDNTALAVLRQIRDLLAGKDRGPLQATSDAISSIASDTTTAGGGNTAGRMGPFGTPIKARNPGYEAAAAAIQALGGDPEKFLGADPSSYMPRGVGSVGGAGFGVGGGGFSQYAALLSTFAKTGNLTSDLTGAGLDANDSVIKAITTARNKKRGALGDDAIAALVEQVVGVGGYTGTLDSSNSALISSLQTFREKLGKGTALGGGGALMGLPAGVGPKGSKAGLQPGASQLWDFITTNFPEVREIGGVRQDAIADHPSGRALDIMVGNDKALGDRINQSIRANAPALGLDSTIWRDKWEDLGGNSSTVAGHQDHVHAKVAEGAATGLGGLQLPGGVAGLGAGAGGVTPVYVTNFDGQMRGGAGGDMLSALLAGGGQSLGDVSADALSAALGKGNRPLPKDVASTSELFKQRNPAALASLAGYQVGDYNRTGGNGQADDLTVNDGPKYNAQGQIYSDTAALIDRSFTSLEAQMRAGFEQLQDVTAQVRDQLVDISSQLAQIAASSAGSAAGTAAGAAVPGLAAGGPIWGGVPGKDSVPILAMPNEHMLTVDDVAAMGGHAGVYAFRRALHAAPGFATGGGVNVNDTVGAEFFGVSQIPILGAIVNLLVRVLLKVLGVEIEARDTLGEMTDEFRQFRGEFQAFDASGRLMNDTSALIDRSSTSEEEAAQERIRILKIVIEALIKYIIEKVIVPIAKAVANAAISAGAGAAGAGLNSVAPGAGGIVSSLISSGGAAGVDIIAEIGSQFAISAASVIVDMLAGGLQSYFPDAVGAIFGGGLLENLIAAPITAALEIPLAIIGALTGGLTGLFAPLLAIFGGATFDQGGVASGVGLMPKAIIAPERVLSPSETVKWERMIQALERNPNGAAGGSPTYVQAEIHVAGGPEAGRGVRDGLLELMS
ncbi:hypothetical protein [Mycobacterium sp. NPDC050853]|uniref:hypothetical protein n=1 Tax=Mycobacterium sp. NPDC050853 TaxID=3155160 RepID=UPI0033F74F23